METKWVKYQALGNSFIVLDMIYSDGRGKEFTPLATAICDSSVGIGADGMLVLSQQDERYRIDIYNSDGSWAEKSGNGLRIGAMHLLQRGKIKGSTVELETGSGVSRVTFHDGNEMRQTISGSLGKPVFKAADIPVRFDKEYFIHQTLPCGGRSYLASAVSVGNPHLVLFCDNLDFDWPLVGEELETNELFPERINVGFVVVKGDHEIEVRDWERGVGETTSSGTGAAAAVAIAVMRGFIDREVEVHTQAGVLHVTWDGTSDEIIIKGPVEYIGEGVFEYRT